MAGNKGAQIIKQKPSPAAKRQARKGLTKAQKEAYQKRKEFALKKEKDNYEKLCVIKYDDTWWRMFDHSALLYKYDVAKRLGLEVKIHKDKDFRGIRKKKEEGERGTLEEAVEKVSPVGPAVEQASGKPTEDVAKEAPKADGPAADENASAVEDMQHEVVYINNIEKFKERMARAKVQKLYDEGGIMVFYLGYATNKEKIAEYLELEDHFWDKINTLALPEELMPALRGKLRALAESIHNLVKSMRKDIVSLLAYGLDLDKLGNDDRLWNELFLACIEARKGKRHTYDVERLDGLNGMRNIGRLADDIINGTYKPSRGVAFIIEKPVPREIFAAAFRDRLVHHFLINMDNGWLDRRLIRDSYSCRRGKGTLDAIQRAEHFLRDELKLILHPLKRKFQEVSKGLDFLGAVIYPHCTVPGKRFARNFYEAAYKCAIGDKEVASVASYLGYAGQFDAQKLCKNIFDGLGWEYRF